MKEHINAAGLVWAPHPKNPHTLPCTSVNSYIHGLTENRKPTYYNGLTRVNVRRKRVEWSGGLMCVDLEPWDSDPCRPLVRSVF